MKQDYNAKLSDFGLARDGPQGDKTHVSTRVLGTYGYAAPEYVMTGRYLFAPACVMRIPYHCSFCEDPSSCLLPSLNLRGFHIPSALMS